MKLVYKANGDEVKVGDNIDIKGEPYRVVYFAKPHKPQSSGKVTVHWLNGDASGYDMEYFVGVIGAHWIEREDQ